MKRTAAAAVSLARNGAAPGAAEHRLAGAPERSANAGPFAVLQEHDGNQGQAHHHMQDDNRSCHNFNNINKGSCRRKPFSGEG